MQKIDTIPNFFIVGAPKCGTTALSRYLGQHHNIFISTPKEPHFFASDFKNHRAIGSFEEYQKLFATCSREHLAVGEASVWYLYSQVAVRNIFDFNKQSKIIVMLRNPIDLVYSLHSQHIYAFYEDREQFQTAWELQEERSRGQKIPRMCRQPELLQYGKVGKLGEQLERVLEIFPRCQVKMILFDDFKAETKRVYVDVLSFLGVPDDQREDFPVINQNKAHRLMWLSQILQNRNNGPAFWLKYIRGSLNIKFLVERAYN